MAMKEPDFDEMALDWLRTFSGHVPVGREQKLGKLLREAYELGRQRGREEREGEP